MFSRHVYSHRSGEILGLMTPGGANGLESLFQTMGVSLDENDKVPDLNQPVEHLLEEIKGLEKIKNSSQPSVANKLKIPVNYLSQPYNPNKEYWCNSIIINNTFYILKIISIAIRQLSTTN